MHRTILPEAPEGQDAGAVVGAAGMGPIPDSRKRGHRNREIMAVVTQVDMLAAAVSPRAHEGSEAAVAPVREGSDQHDRRGRNRQIRKSIRRQWTTATARCRMAETTDASGQASVRSNILRLRQNRCRPC